MLELIQAIPFSFAALFPVLNPIGSSVIILSFVDGVSPKKLNKLAYQIALYTATMLIAVLLTGSGILRLFGISIPIMLIGGGLLLAYIGWEILAQPSSSPKEKAKEVAEATSADEDIRDRVFYPLTMPVTAGPGCIAVVIALGAHGSHEDLPSTLLHQAGNGIGIILVALTVYFCYRYSHVIAAKMGPSGTAVIMRIAGFFNLCIGLELMWHGVAYLLHLTV